MSLFSGSLVPSFLLDSFKSRIDQSVRLTGSSGDVSSRNFMLQFFVIFYTYQKWMYARMYNVHIYIIQYYIFWIVLRFLLHFQCLTLLSSIFRMFHLMLAHFLEVRTFKILSSPKFIINGVVFQFLQMELWWLLLMKMASLHSWILPEEHRLLSYRVIFLP